MEVKMLTRFFHQNMAARNFAGSLDLIERKTYNTALRNSFVRGVFFIMIYDRII